MPEGFEEGILCKLFCIFLAGNDTNNQGKYLLTVFVQKIFIAGSFSFQYILNDTLLANISDEQIDDTLNDESEVQIAKLNKAMKKLDADERAVITLFYMEDKPVSEIALILGMTESNTKVKLHRIRKKLYVLITNEKL